VPELEREIDKSSKNVVEVRIINTGFQTFSQSADMTQYSGVKDENIIPFLMYYKS